MRPTEILMTEHRVIEQVLDCVDRMTAQCESSGRLDAESATKALDFLRTFADRCHHGKEERQLFPMMEQRGFPKDDGPVAVMCAEHERGRLEIRGMAEAITAASAGDAESCAAWVRHARGYVGLLREHIRKEDHCLFPMADQALTEGDQAALLQRFERVEQDEIGAGVHERYVRIADELAERFDVPARSAGLTSGGGCCGH